MKNKFKQIALLITISLFCIFALQVYYAIEVYHQKSMVFQSEVNQAFEKAVEKTNKQRLEKINLLFEKDIRDTSEVDLVYDVSSEGPKLLVNNPKTGYKHLSLSIKKPIDKSLDYEDLVKIAVEENWKLLQNESILYWTQKIGDNLKAYSDTLSISSDTLRKNMKRELKKFDIDSDFTFVKSDSLYQYDKTNPNFKINMLPVKLDGETLLSTKIINPEITILERLSIVLLFTFIAFFLLLYSFYYIYQTLKKQTQLSILKDDFIDNVTHELITPTATLKLALETLEKKEENLKSNYVIIAKHHANRIETIVQQILNSSFKSSTEEKVQFQKIELKPLISSITEYYKHTNKDSLKIDNQILNSIKIYSSKEYLYTVLHNVISNAIKYGNPKAPEIQIFTKEEGNYTVIYVADNGNGIPKEHQQLIFEKFHRVPTSTHDVKGLGIGLYYSKLLMSKLNGDIKLIKSSSKGSVFAIYLKNEEIV